MLMVECGRFGARVSWPHDCPQIARSTPPSGLKPENAGNDEVSRPAVFGRRPR
jgi:hypothetical protein